MYKPQNKSEQETTPPPVSSDNVASNYSASRAQASTVHMMIAPSIVVPGPTGTNISSQQGSAGMAQGTNIGAQSQSLLFGNNFSQPVINNSTS